MINTESIMQKKRLSMHLGNKVKRAYSELDAILEEERKLQFRKTQAGQARERLWGSSPAKSQAKTVEPEKTSPKSKRYTFSPRSPRDMQRRREQAALAAVLKRPTASFTAFKLAPANMQTVKIKKPPLGIRRELAGKIVLPESNTEDHDGGKDEVESSSSAEENSSGSDSDGDDEMLDEERANKQKKKEEELKREAEAEMVRQMQKEEDLNNSAARTIVDELPVSFILRPKVRGLDEDARKIKGDPIAIRNLKRSLIQYGLSSEGSDNQLKLRLAQYHLRRELENYRLHNPGRRKRSDSTSSNSAVGKRTSLMRRLAQMGNAQMWRNLGNENVKRYVETFTLIHHADDENEKVDKLPFGLGDKSKMGADANVANLRGYVRKRNKEHKTLRRHCALCNYTFHLKNMPRTVTLKAVWNKRSSFPKAIKMPENMKGRWDKLYGEVHVCAFCSQYFEPKVRSKDEQIRYEMEELRRAREATGSYALGRKGDADTSGDVSSTVSREQRSTCEERSRKIQKHRSRKLMERNRSVFKRATGFGSSNSQRPRSLWGGSLENSDVDVVSKDEVANKHRTPKRPQSAAPSRRSVIRVHLAVPESSSESTSTSARSGPPRPQSAATRLRRRKQGPMAGFGSSSTRIVPYRGHNDIEETTWHFRSTRIDPVKQAKEIAKDESRTEQLTSQAKSSSTIRNRQLTRKSRRPATAQPGRRRRRAQKKSDYSHSRKVPRRPKSAGADWRRRRRRVPRPEWQSVL